MDGQIVYQVRVDHTRIPQDIEAAKGQINSGTATLVTLGQQAAQRIGNALNTFFSSQNAVMSQVLSNLSAGFSHLTGTANGTAAAISPLTSGFWQLSGSVNGAASSLDPLSTGIRTLLGLDLNKLLGFFNQLPTAVAGAGAALGAATGITTALNAISGNNTSSTLPRYRSGSDYIEKDKYALLHKGEAVLTAAENETLKSLGGMEGVSLMAAQRTEPIVMAQQQNTGGAIEVQPQNVNVTVELDGYQMAKVMATATNDLNRQLNTRVIK